MIKLTPSLLLILAAPTIAQIVPAPRSLRVARGAAVAGDAVRCEAPAFRPAVDAFVDALKRLGVATAAVIEDGAVAPVVSFVHERSVAAAGYRIDVKGGRFVVKASASEGAAHAAASLLQTLSVTDGRAEWPRLSIKDEPDFFYRSFMVDMGRNPHSPATLRAVVDMLWLYKANVLHLHLTDDQLFSWPSEAYPKLHEARSGWSRDEFVALEAYARARGVVIVPEIDVPGHSTILRREYPEVFGATVQELATSPAAQRGVETLISELLSVFESTPYVHIGGDEAYGVPADDQRDFINRLNAFVKSKGRRTVVWEGPGLGVKENKVDEDVIHMNWQTVAFPAQEMLDAGYEVVSAPWNPLYIVDHYPKTMFTAVDVERCYAWDPQSFAQVDHGFPTFTTPHRTKTARGILGFCMPWWEGRPENLFALCVPRFAAVASAAWNREGESDFADFQRRQERALDVFERISGVELPETPFANPETQVGNVAYRTRVVPSDGATQPHFGPDRLTNGITDRFDHFLGFPTQPTPLDIVLEFDEPQEIGRIVVYETAVGESHEIYDLLVSSDGRTYKRVGHAEKGSRGESNHVEHVFPWRRVSFIKIETQGCHGLTFPSFSRLTEVKAYRN